MACNLASVRESVGIAAGYSIRPASTADLELSAVAWFHAFGTGTLAAARSDLAAGFEGAYGELIPESTMVVEQSGIVVAGVFTVRRAPWDDTPDGPFVIDLFTEPEHQRRGLAGVLLVRVLENAFRAGESVVGLRVDLANTAAQSLYRAHGFRDWSPR